MKTQQDIKAVLFDYNQKDTQIVSKFLQLKNSELFSFHNENELGVLINNLKSKYNSKEVIILKSFKGRGFQICPGSQGVTCCNYRLINTCFNCLYDCTYCFLNSYLNSFGIQQFTNMEDIYKEIDTFLPGCDENFIYRIGSGEFTDSLMLDSLTGIGENLIRKFSSKKNIMIELKTKSNNVDHLLNIKNKGSTVLAWSLNTVRNIKKYEPGSASLDERLEAAEKAGKAGFFLAFHFDPIIIYDNWKNDYRDVIDILFTKVNPEKVVWISLGGFRYSSSFKEILRDKYPDEELTIEEMFPGIDGKYRYLKSKRINIYKIMKRFISSHTNKPFVYLCMETQDVWHSVFHKYFDSALSMEKDFSEYLKKTFRICS